MEIRFIICILTFTFSINSKGQNCDNVAVGQFIKNLFNDGQYISYDSGRFRGFNEDLVFINTPVLNKLMPDYCFYSTSFNSNYIEFLNVEVALAFSRNKSKKSFITHSPLYSEASVDFLKLFYGLKVNDRAQQKAAAKEITEIFSRITYKGHVNRLISLQKDNLISFELWNGDLSWRIYDFYFDNTSTLTIIKISNGVGRSQMNEHYRRP